MTRGDRLRRLALSFVGAALVFVVAGEVLARAFRIVDRMNGFPRQLFVATDDPQLPYVMRPGFDTVVRGARVTVNALGLRHPPADATPAPGVRRVLAIGDSATFGENLPVADAWPAQLERELVRRTGERWEVLNGGVEGYNTEAELAWLRQHGLALRPEIVVVGFNLNDFDDAPVLGPLGILTTRRADRVSTWSPANWSELYLLIRWLVATRGTVWVGDAAAPPPVRQPGAGRFDAFDRAVSTVRKRWYRNPDEARFTVLVDSLRGLAETARAHRLRMVLAIIPDGDQIRVPNPDLAAQHTVRSVCAKVGLPALDLTPAFAASPEPELFLNIMHPNAAGYAVVARQVADYLLAVPGAGTPPAAPGSSASRGRQPITVAGTPPTME